MLPKKVFIYDTTLRDGAQMSGISFTVEDKLKIASILDDFGVHFIEGGWPGSNPTDEMFFNRAKKELKLKNAKLTAFSSTRLKNISVENDPNLKALLNCGVQYACIFGKTWDMHVIHALRISLKENLNMISQTIKYLKFKKMNVIYDAEHFFDGFIRNRKYAMEVLETAIRSGAESVILCDTNGGTLPHKIGEITEYVKKYLQEKKMNVMLGIHAHNDNDCAVANTITAVIKGATIVHGTINGYGERCGNANLCSVIPNIQLKLKIKCVSERKLKSLVEVSRFVSEIANLVRNEHMPYVGESAFTHKGGVHVSAIKRKTTTYEHINPEVVGNKRKIIISELAGRSNVSHKIKELKLDFARNKKNLDKIIQLIKKLEHQGYQFENADGSFAITAYKVLGKHKPFFELKGFRVIIEKDPVTGKLKTEATIKVSVNNIEEHTAAEGDGPVNALDNALRKALEKFYPSLKEITLTDFKVRVINANAGTAAKVRVIIETKDSRDLWGTTGVSENIIEASWQALVDAIEYKLMKDKEHKFN